MIFHMGRRAAPIVVAATAAISIGAAVVAEPLIGVIAAVSTVAVAFMSYSMNTVLPGAIAIFPLVPGGAELGGSASLTVQRLILAVLLVAVIAKRDLWAEHAWRVRLIGMAVRWFLAFLAIGIVSAVLSPLPIQALRGVGFYAVQVGGMLIAGCLLARGEDREKYLVAVSVGVIGVATLSFLQYAMPTNALGHVLGPVFTNEATGETGVRALSIRVSGPFVHPVALGDYAALTLPFVLLAANARTIWCSRLGRIALVMALGVLMLSQTRMAMLSATAAIVVWLAVTGRRRGAVATVGIATLVIVAAFGPKAASTQADIIAAALSYRGETTAATPRMQSVVGRASLYVAGSHALGARPIVGYGMRVPTQHAQADIFRRYGQTYAFESYLIVLLLEVGVLGLVAFVAFVGSLAHAVHRRCYHPEDRATIYAALAGAATLAVGSTAFDPNVTYFWLMVGVVLGTGLQRRGMSDVIPVSTARVTGRLRTQHVL